MNDAWQDFLNQQNSNLEQQRKIIFSEDTATTLSACGIIRFSGKDAQTFLQGQITCDTNEANSEQAILGALCTYQGRIVCVFSLFKIDEDYYWLINKSLIEKTLEYLKKYALFSKVTLTHLDNAVILGAAGSSSQLSSKHFIKLYNPTYPQYFTYGSLDEITETWKELSPSFKPVHYDNWRQLELRTGIPHIHPETTEHFLPHMLNLHHLDAISFTKGCYTGQEIIARTQHRGELKRKMALFEICTDKLYQPGTKLTLLDNEKEVKLGELVDCCYSDSGTLLGLVVINITLLEELTNIHLLNTGEEIRLIDKL